MLKHDDVYEIVYDNINHCFDTSCGLCSFHITNTEFRSCLSNIITDRLMHLVESEIGKNELINRGLEDKTANGVVTLTRAEIGNLNRVIGALGLIKEILNAAEGSRALVDILGESTEVIHDIVTKEGDV